MSTAAWTEWAAYNLARGVPRADVAAEMVSNGVDAVEDQLEAIASHPVFAAAQKLSGELGRLTALNDALLSLEQQTFDFRRIPRVKKLSSIDFQGSYYSRNLPVVVEDVVPDWPAVSRWTLDSLEGRFGNEPVRFQRGRSLLDHRDSFVDHTEAGTFSDFLRLLRYPPSGEAAPYLIAHDRLLDRDPFSSLLDDVIFDSRYFDAGSPKTGKVFFWLGPKDSSTPLHRDLGNVYLAQIMGRKLVRMVPSKQLHLIYNEVGYHSEAHFDPPDLEKYPNLKKASISEVILSPGDLLFIPLGWWHYVKSLDTTISVTGNNFAFSNEFTPIF